MNFREVDKAVKNCEELERQWRSILDGKTGTKHDDYDRISNELRNSIRSIEWDLEDLDETINILLQLFKKFIQLIVVVYTLRLVREVWGSIPKLIN